MIYLRCECANPPETSVDPCGSGHRDIRYLYRDISRADTIVNEYRNMSPETEWWGKFQWNTAEFLSQHRDCALSVADGKGNVLPKGW